MTPLHVATLDNRLEIVKLLLARGAAPSPKSKGRMTPLHMAARDGRHRAWRWR